MFLKCILFEGKVTQADKKYIYANQIFFKFKDTSFKYFLIHFGLFFR